MATKPKAKKTAQPKAFTVLLNINREDYSSTADTLDEALLNLPQVVPHTRAVITIVYGEKQSRPFSLAIPQFRRLFYPGLTGQIQRIQLSKRFQITA